MKHILLTKMLFAFSKALGAGIGWSINLLVLYNLWQWIKVST